VRKGFIGFISRLTGLYDLEDVSITTNGVLLREDLIQLYDSGLRRINISLDTLNRLRFQYIKGVAGFRNVWEAITLKIPFLCFTGEASIRGDTSRLDAAGGDDPPPRRGISAVLIPTHL
jgi:hypothetical protein